MFALRSALETAPDQKPQTQTNIAPNITLNQAKNKTAEIHAAKSEESHLKELDAQFRVHRIKRMPDKTDDEQQRQKQTDAVGAAPIVAFYAFHSFTPFPLRFYFFFDK